MNAHENLAIVIIGQNESQTLTEVLERCVNLTTKFNVHVIYVDSNSGDNSLKLACSFAEAHRWLEVTILNLSGHLNAAVARNAGLGHVENQTRWLFFLDADIVFETEFVSKAVNKLKEDGKIGTVTGKLKETYINGPPGNIHERGPRAIDKNGSIQKHGGSFVTINNLIKKLGGFDERLAQHEDLDLCLRIRRKGWTLLLLDECLGTHHTVSYNAPKRIWSDLKRGRGLSSGILIRKYLFSRYLLDTFLTTKPYIFKLCVILMMIGGLIIKYFPLLFFGSALFVLISIRRNKGAGESTLAKALSFLCGINLLLGLFYFPSKRQYKIKEIKTKKMSSKV